MKAFTIILATVLTIASGIFIWWAFSPLLFDNEVQDTLDPNIQAELDSQKPNTVAEKKVDDKVDVIEGNEERASVFSQGPFSITGTAGHPASGDVKIISTPEESLLQYINYDGTNGPDLYVYLSKDLDAKEYIELSAQKGNQGNIIYGLPLDIDLSEYRYILTWCKAFGVLFDYAEIK